MIRAVIDVNVLVSAILGPLGFSRRVVLAWEAGEFDAISSEGIISELEEKLSQPRITRRYNVDSPADIRWIEALLRTQADVIVVAAAQIQTVTRDPEDDLVLATARLAGAHYLVTGDKRLLELADHEGTKIVTPKEFIELLGGSLA
jgi:uncharacterized protein